MTQERTLAEAVAQVRQDEVDARIQHDIEAGVPAAEILAECNRGMVELGNRFAEGECFIPELMYGGMIMKQVMARLGPLLEGSGDGGAAAAVVLGSVQHDVHDIGKDIVAMMLRGVGFEVIDLGTDVAPERFVEAIREHQPAVVGMSVLLTTCYKSVVDTVEAVRRAGLRDGVAMMVGGAAASELLSKNAGCDFYGKTAVDGVDFASRTAGVG